MFFCYIGSVSAATIESTGGDNCNRIDTVDFGNGYTLKHFTTEATTIRNVGRTELYFNDELQEYQDTVFYSNGYVLFHYQGALCDVYSRLASAEMTGSTISVDYDYFNARANSSTTNPYYNEFPTYFTTDVKNITDVSVSVYPFGYAPYYYVKLNLKDNTVSPVSNIASQGFFENIIDRGGASAGSSLSSRKRYNGGTCVIDDIVSGDENYEVNYTCTVSHYKSASAINGDAKTTYGTKSGTFLLSQDNYSLCAYDQKFCGVYIPEPTNLIQEMKSPFREKRNLEIGETVGKHQSGSGIILSTDLVNNGQTELFFEVVVFSSGSILPVTTATGAISEGRTEVVLSDLGEGDYYWRARTINDYGYASEFVDIGDNALAADFSIFEGFEPYPHGFSFDNAKPDYSILTGGLGGELGKTIIPGTKWEIFNEVFHGSTESKIVWFTGMRLDDPAPTLFNGFCSGLSVSALNAYYRPEENRKYFPEFQEQIDVHGSVWNAIDEPKTGEGDRWNVDNTEFRAIAGSQLIQQSPLYSNLRDISKKNENSIDILNRFKDDPKRPYIISISGRNCYFEGICNEQFHAVVPYRAEGNRLYIWDNEVSYPSGNAYNQYITANEDGTWERSHNTGDPETWQYPMTMGMVNLDQYYSLENDNILELEGNGGIISFSGSADVIVIDEQGRAVGYLTGAIVDSIPGAYVIPTENMEDESGNITTWKQIRIPETLDNFEIKVSGNTDESYTLMIQDGDYFTKADGVETSSGQVDTFTPTRTSLEVDFDEDKTGEYNLLIDNFYESGTGTVYLDKAVSSDAPQKYTIDWDKVVADTTDAVILETDTDADGSYDTQEELPAINIDNVAPRTAYTLSGTLDTQTGSNVYITEVTIELDARDNPGGSGLKDILYSVNGGEEKSYTGTLSFTDIGEYTLSYYAIDNKNNIEEAHIVSFQIIAAETNSGKISGYVYKDKNKNGVFDEGEKTKKRWKVYIDVNNDGKLQKKTEPFYKTKKDGYYEFTDLPAGDYIIRAKKRKKLIYSPVEGFYELTLGNGEMIENIDFGKIRNKKKKKNKK